MTQTVDMDDRTTATARSGRSGDDTAVMASAGDRRLCGDCRVCGGPPEIIPGLPWPRFRHSDWSVVSTAPWDLVACRRCGIAGPRSRSAGDVTALYADQSYADRNVPVHHVRPPGGTALVPAPRHQADILQRYLPPSPAILDVGCFDGRLLRALRASSPTARLVGYDVSDGLRRFFPPQAGIAFFSDDRAWQAGPFDMVVFSHALQYVDDLSAILQRVAASLSPCGHVFIQVPDLEKRPVSLLLGDLHHHFTAMSLANLLSLNGFALTAIEPTGFARDLVVVGSRTAPVRSGLAADGAERVAAALRALDAIAQRTRELMETGGGNVFGTTIDAAFVAHILGDGLVAFIDEAPQLAGGTFMSRAIRHPGTLGPDERTFVPFGASATALLTRLRQSFKGEFLLI
jgi:SAM-dependent methyltransferase